MGGVGGLTKDIGDMGIVGVGGSGVGRHTKDMHGRHTKDMRIVGGGGGVLVAKDMGGVGGLTKDIGDMGIVGVGGMSGGGHTKDMRIVGGGDMGGVSGLTGGVSGLTVGVGGLIVAAGLVVAKDIMGIVGGVETVSG